MLWLSGSLNFSGPSRNSPLQTLIYSLIPGARFSKVPKSFRARKAVPNILNLGFPELSFCTKKVNFHAKLAIRCFLFEIQLIKNGFTGPISYRVFRETGPRKITKAWVSLQVFYSDFHVFKSFHCTPAMFSFRFVLFFFVLCGKRINCWNHKSIFPGARRSSRKVFGPGKR